MQSHNIACSTGDGIGPEVMAEAIKVLNKVQKIWFPNLTVEFYVVVLQLIIVVTHYRQKP